MQYFKLGDYNAVCDLCGGTFKASKMRKTWDGYYVCQTDWYPRNPLDFQPRVSEESVPPWTRPRGIDKNLSGGELTASGIIQFYNGVATSPYIPDITASSFVYFYANYTDGRIGTYTISITPNVGFKVFTTSLLELSTISYTAIFNPNFLSSTPGYLIPGYAIPGDI